MLAQRYRKDVAGELVRELEGKPPGLVHALTSFVGRSAAIGKVAEMLAEYRLVTVTGPGGVGKTRLADEVLKQVAERFADGVQVIELAAVQDPELVPAAVATVLGLRQAAGVSIVEALAARLARQQLLLVFDNCEHVLDSVSQFCAVIVSAADDIRILATSREPLGLPEEARYRLPPLALPGPKAAGNPAQSEAVTLFAERARQLNPDFVLDSVSGAMVERLVRRLDGMPLAIELAAARVEALGLPQLADRLDDRFRLLASTNRAAVARQRSLEAAVDWSYQLLDDSEQRVFRFLSVFPGPFTLDAAEAVAGPDSGPAVLRLVDCSLLVPPRTGPDGRSRYLMLETLRGHGAEQLRQAGEDHPAASALAAHALHVAERAGAQMEVHDQEQPALLWLDAEDAAVHQGLAWGLDHDPATALRLALALAPWWRVRGRWAEGYVLLQRAAGPAESGGRDWCSAHLWLGQLSRLMASDSGIPLEHFSAVIDVLQNEAPTPELVDCLAGRSAALRNRGHLGQAAADAGTALELARQIGYSAGEAAALQELSVTSLYAGQDEDALAWVRQADRIDENRMSGWRARDVKNFVSFVLVNAGHADGAQNLCEQVLADARTTGDLGVQADALHLLAVLAFMSGRPSDAGVYLRETAKLAIQGSYLLRLIDILEETGYLCAATERHAEAISLWAARAAQNQAAGLLDTPQEEGRREPMLREITRALGQQQLEAAEARGAAMTLAAAVEFAVMMTEQSAPAPTSATTSQPGLLSARERELVTLVAQGRTDAEIAEKLFISISTVRTHLDRIRDKSGCRRRADLTRLALRQGII
jgi:predicted ATPase/DNA-binding CsgD family transcriptional regulator